VPYLAQLLAGYRTGLDHEPPESGEAVRAALTEEDDAYRRGILLGLLANSLVQPDRSSSKIGETTKLQRAVIEAIQESLAPCRQPSLQSRRGACGCGLRLTSPDRLQISSLTI
jgi:hypothetical protein